MKHILIIDDNEPICELMQVIMEMQGYRTTIRMTGQDALPFIEKLHPDLILLDVMLDQGIDGREICHAIKQSSSGVKEIPVVMVSATHNLQDALHCRCQPDDFISKPFDIDHLAHVVQQQLAAR